MDDDNEFLITSSCNTIDDKKDHVQYLQYQRAIPDDCTCSLTEQNIAINDHHDAMILHVYIGHYMSIQDCMAVTSICIGLVCQNRPNL